MGLEFHSLPFAESSQHEVPTFRAHQVELKNAMYGYYKKYQVIDGSGDAIVIEITNNETIPIHVCVMSYQADGSIVVLHPHRDVSILYGSIKLWSLSASFISENVSLILQRILMLLWGCIDKYTVNQCSETNSKINPILFQLCPLNLSQFPFIMVICSVLPRLTFHFLSPSDQNTGILMLCYYLQSEV